MWMTRFNFFTLLSPLQNPKVAIDLLLERLAEH